MPRSVTPGACWRYAASWAPARDSPDRARDRRSTHRDDAGPPASPLRAHLRREIDPEYSPRRPISRLPRRACRTRGPTDRKVLPAIPARRRIHFGRENQPAAGAFGSSCRALEMPKRAVLELALLGEPAVFLPLAEPLVPLQSQRTGLGGRGTMGAAIGVEPIRHLIGRAPTISLSRAVSAETARSLRAIARNAFLAVAVDRCHAQFSGAASLSQIRQMSSMVSRPREAVNPPCSLEPFARHFLTNINSL